MDSLPYDAYPVEWEGWGASSGYGGEASDPRYGGENTLVAVAYSLQPVHTLIPPRPRTFIDSDGVALYPVDHAEFAALATGAAARPTYYADADYAPSGIVGEDFMPDVPLAGPEVNRGATLTGGA